MIVNTASKCGLTPQYKDLEAIYKEYKDQNFVIIGFQQIILDRKNRELMKISFANKIMVLLSNDGQSIRKRGDMCAMYQFLTQNLKGLEDSDVAFQST
jgi:glutathione peroxidase